MVIFPFSAVVANDNLKLALLLNVIDPRIGGVLIKGPRGSAKSTLARALADIAGIERGRFVLLPLGADEERVVGSIDLNKVLKDGQVSFNPGLLHRAHKGILYVDEVNLLADHLVDILLDVCASGVNTLERDGISTAHPARFILVGTMNPDEGELRPQLLDRFGLCVQLYDNLDIDQRMLVVQRRIAFDENPDAFVQSYQDRQSQLILALQQARQQLGNINFSADSQRYACQICHAAGVEGVRADITLQRAAAAYAAWQQMSDVSHDCIDRVAEFVLLHRRPDVDNDDSNSIPKAGRNSAVTDSRQEIPRAVDNLSGAQGDWGEMPAIHTPMGVPKNVDAIMSVADAQQDQKKNAENDLSC